MNRFPILVAALLSAGSFWLADQAIEDLPPRMDVNGRLLRMRIEGEGSPAVVLEIGLGGALEEWAAVQPAVAHFTKVVSYDRLGAVDRQPMLTGEDVARELRAALRLAGVEPPFVLVGQSFGGVYNRVFASMYPNEVAGIVLLDPSHEDFIAWMELNYPEKCLSRADVENWPEGKGIWATLEWLNASPPLPTVPITVVTGTRPYDHPIRIKSLPVWTKSHADWVATLGKGRHVLAPESGHAVHVEAARRVIDVILDVVQQGRAMDSESTSLDHPVNL